MATFADGLQQATNEIHTYTIDFTNDLPTAGTVTAGTATHLPPSGAVSPITVTVSSPYLFATVPALGLVGSHFIDVLATFNNGDKSNVRLPINVVYPAPAARVGMSALIAELRGLAEATPSDYTVAGSPYWTDAQLQDVLDIHRQDIMHEEMAMYPVPVAGGTLQWMDYRSGYGFFEASTGGTAVFYLQDGTGGTIAASAYSTDYRRGRVTFNANTAGTIAYLTGRSYDLNAAAADVWRRKSSHYAGAFDFSTDNHSISRSQVYKHCIEMAQFYEGLGGEGMQTVTMYRGDVA